MENPQKEVANLLMNALQPEKAPESEAETPQPEVVEPETVVSENEPEQSEAQVEVETSELQAEPSEGDIDTLNDLASELDTDIADLYALNVKMPDADPKTLGFLKNFYLENQDIGQARQEIEATKSDLEQAKSDLNQTAPIPQEMLLAQARIMQLEQAKLDLDSSGLRMSNPSEYLLQQQNLDKGLNEAKSIMQNIDQIVEAQTNTRKQEEQQKLFGKMPDLKNDEFRESSFKGLTELVQKYGFNESDLEYVLDHRLMHMLLDYANLSQKVGKLKGQKIDKAPKVLKPQSVQNSLAGRKASLKRLTEKARNSNSNRDKASAVNAILLNRG